MRTGPSKDSLSAARRRLVELMQRLNFGRIEGLAVADGDPVLDPPPHVVAEIKFGGENGPLDLFEHMERLGIGKIEVLEVKHGLPFRMLVARVDAADRTQLEDPVPSPAPVSATAPPLTVRQLDVLQALKEMNATSRSARRTTDEIAVKVNGGTPPDSFKRPIADLSARGLVQTEQRKGGGVWITPAGLNELGAHPEV
jgi:hypothetical protein